jgi:nucleotide-binding universal stress UspA family protein
MEQQILVPLDGSLLAESVIPYAVELARAQGNALHLLRVITPATVAPSLAWPMPAPVNIERWLEADRQSARDYLNLLGNQIHAADIKVQTTVAEGNPAEIIIGLARSKVSSIASIAMATHGRHGVERWVLGSVAEKVLHAAPVPLLLVRGTTADTPAEAGMPHSPAGLRPLLSPHPRAAGWLGPGRAGPDRGPPAGLYARCDAAADRGGALLG